MKRHASPPKNAAGEAEVPECTACGTCCFSELPEYVRVWGCDWDRMDDRARELTHFIGNRCFMRLEEGHCAALVIDPSSKQFLCSIYAMRPDCCRALERGSGACLGELHTKSERPLIALEALVRKAPPIARAIRQQETGESSPAESTSTEDPTR